MEKASTSTERSPNTGVDEKDRVAFDYPLASIAGIQFSISSSKEINKASVHAGDGVISTMQLSSPLLGIPNKTGKCEQCGTDKLNECDGHFGHIKLPFPIYHPSHMKFVKEILEKVCLNCLEIKSKKNNISAEQLRDYVKAGVNENGLVTLTGMKLKEEPDDFASSVDGVGVLSKNDCFMKDFKNVTLLDEATSSSADKANFSSSKKKLRKDHSKGESSTNSKFSKGKATTFASDDHQMGSYKSTPSKKKGCKYCMDKKDRDYPPFKIQISGKNENASFLELKVTSKSHLFDDYWTFLGEHGGYKSGSSSKSRVLLPYEASKILKKIPEKIMKKICVNPLAVKPDGLILDCIPVPPNCIRIPDALGSTVKISDYGVQMLKKIVSCVQDKQLTMGKNKFSVHREATKELQSLFTQYLKVMGAPKVSTTFNPGSNAQGSDEFSKSFANFWLDKMRSLFISKSCGLSSRCVVTGDVYRGIGEIGIPLEIAKRVTVEEWVTVFNKEKIRKMVEGGKCHTLSRKDGAKFFGEAMKLSGNIEVGDLINRSLQEGDIVFINRPPSIHKHSIQAMRVFLHPGKTMVINPLICGPLGGDFDGDCLHTFFPKSLESKAELLQLLSVDKQIFSSHSGEANIVLTVDTLLAAKLISQSLFVDKATMAQLAMWALRSVPDPAILNPHNGSSLWTAVQVIQTVLPDNMNLKGNKSLIKSGIIHAMDADKYEIQDTLSEIFKSLVEEDGSERALECLHSLECILVEWLSSSGFSVSIEDFVLPASATLKNDLSEISKLIRYMGVGSYQTNILSQVERGVKELQNKIIREIPSSNSFIKMIDCTSSKSTSRLVQQVGFLGIQFFHGKNAIPSDWQKRLHTHLPCGESSFLQEYEVESPEVHGFITSSFISGLNPCEAFIHSVHSREGLLSQKMGLKEPGVLFKNLMAFLRDVTVCYDGTVRNACGNFLVQFQYGKFDDNGSSSESSSGHFVEKSTPGDPVGILAATSIASPAYKAFSDASTQKSVSPWEILEETLKGRDNGVLKHRDRKVVLYMKNCCGAGIFTEKKFLGMEKHDVTCCEKIAAGLQNALKKQILESFAVNIFVEYQERWFDAELRAPLLGHIQLDAKRLMEGSLSPATLEDFLYDNLRKKSHPLNSFLDNLRLQACDACDIAQRSGNDGFAKPCLHFALTKESYLASKGHSHSFYSDLYLMVDVLYPRLAETTVKGDDRIEAVRISWNNQESKTWVASKKGTRNKDGDIVVEIDLIEEEVTQRGDAWEKALHSLLPFMELLDDSRCIPYSVHEVYKLLGVAAAYQLIIQRLTLALELLGKGAYKNHLLLIASCMTLTGKVIAYNAAGFKDLYNSMKYPVPFTEGTLKTPIKSFERASEEGVVDRLSGSVASCCWGKRAPVGTGSNFEIFWKDLEGISKPLEEQCNELDAYETLEVLGVDSEGEKVKPSSLCIGEDMDLDVCLQSLTNGCIFGNKAGTDSFPRNKPSNFGRNKPAMNQDTSCWNQQQATNGDGPDWNLPSSAADDIGWNKPASNGDGAAWNQTTSAMEDVGWGKPASNGDGVDWNQPNQSTSATEDVGWGKPVSNGDGADWSQQTSAAEGVGWSKPAGNGDDGGSWKKPTTNGDDIGWNQKAAAPEDDAGWTQPKPNAANNSVPDSVDWKQTTAPKDDAGWSQPEPNAEKTSATEWNNQSVLHQSGDDAGWKQNIAPEDDGSWKQTTRAEDDAGWSQPETNAAKSSASEWNAQTVTHQRDFNAGIGQQHQRCSSAEGSSQETEWGQAGGMRSNNNGEGNGYKKRVPTGSNAIPVTPRKFAWQGDSAEEKSPFSKEQTNNKNSYDQNPGNSEWGTGGWSDGGSFASSLAKEKDTEAAWNSGSFGSKGKEEGDWGTTAGKESKDDGWAIGAWNEKDKNTGWGREENANSRFQKDETTNSGWGDSGENSRGRGRRGGRGRGESWGRGSGRGEFRGRGYGRGGGGRGGLRARTDDPPIPDEDVMLEASESIIHYMRNILHSERYNCGDKLSPEDEKEVVEKVLNYHPDKDAKIGSGIDYIKIDIHSDYETTKCLHVVSKDGAVSDFSYFKCMKNMLHMKYPENAQAFIDKFGIR
uniref:DNA-directed RNA polymerase subunit n=1 Tax=Ephedra trifurca TaxID=39583 RepID=A0A0C4W3T9_9SPER|nr:DNA-directed RNA polymerase V largest subunit [Ephedra trifurca]